VWVFEVKNKQNLVEINMQIKIIVILSLLLAVVLAIVSYYGVYVPGTYQRDSASMAAQGTGQDAVNLFIVLPLLILTLLFWAKHGNRIALYVYSGTIFYILYSFVIYCFGVYFNNLFLLYCITLGLSLYLFIMIVVQFQKADAQQWFDDKIPVKTIGIYLIVVGIMFYALWLKDIIPAIMQGTVPPSVSDYKLLVNPVHVIDIAIALPGLIITAVLLMIKHRLGYIFTPILLVFIILLTVALIGMVIMLNIEGISEDISLVYIFAILAIISLVFLIIFLRNLKSEMIIRS
jgi:hypothetical protein